MQLVFSDSKVLLFLAIWWIENMIISFEIPIFKYMNLNNCLWLLIIWKTMWLSLYLGTNTVLEIIIYMYVLSFLNREIEYFICYSITFHLMLFSLLMQNIIINSSSLQQKYFSFPSDHQFSYLSFISINLLTYFHL